MSVTVKFTLEGYKSYQELKKALGTIVNIIKENENTEEKDSFEGYHAIKRFLESEGFLEGLQ